jgi:hypothetical protein
MTDPLKFGFDALNYESNGLEHDVNAANDASIQLCEAYVRRDVACHFHLRIYIGGKGHSHDLCADFQASGRLGDSQWSGGPIKGDPFVVEGQYVRGKQQWVEHLVFVPVGEVAEGSDGPTRVVASWVGLRTVNDCPVRRRDFVEMHPLVREPLATVLNRELNPLSLSPALGNLDVTAVELPEQVVEGTSEIVNSVSQNHSDFKPPVFWNCCEPKDVIARLRVKLGVHVEDFGFPTTDGVNYGIQSFAMLLRPLNLGLTLSKVNRHD